MILKVKDCGTWVYFEGCTFNICDVDIKNKEINSIKDNFKDNLLDLILEATDCKHNSFCESFVLLGNNKTKEKLLLKDKTLQGVSNFKVACANNKDGNTLIVLMPRENEAFLINTNGRTIERVC